MMKKRAYKQKNKIKGLNLNQIELLKDNREEKYNDINSLKNNNYYTNNRISYKEQIKDINYLNNEMGASQNNINSNKESERINDNNGQEILKRKYQNIINELKNKNDIINELKNKNVELKNKNENLNKINDELTILKQK